MIERYPPKDRMYTINETRVLTLVGVILGFLIGVAVL